MIECEDKVGSSQVDSPSMIEDNVLFLDLPSNFEVYIKLFCGFNLLCCKLMIAHEGKSMHKTTCKTRSNGHQSSL